ncbi:MAG: HIT family protein [Bacteroidales bacterium]|nr:HIT family protein [Bacteroidales bacterium]MEE0937173.1 HIT family protein [Bacteroidales bacterium]MEE1093429.1 HIT family protein [Bacteroidales bacterium]MEE1097221.1 HIT family protein [Bacteroidales bacterium]MEE1203513.1 HIT family protein [Bacteroidales bacterium]
MASIFTKIINGEIPSYKIAEDDKFYAFLDIAPLAKGHTLVVPKQEIDYIFDIEDELLAQMHIFSKKVAKAIQSAIPCEKVGMAVIGLDVRHAHIHLVPLQEVGDLNFAKEKLKLSSDEMKQTSELIASKFENQ